MPEYSLVNRETGEILDESLPIPVEDSFIVPVSPFQINGPGCSVTHPPTQEEASVFGQELFFVKKNLPWILGDYCNLVDNYLDENIYLQLLKVGDIDFRTLQNYKYVAGKVPFSRRRESLFWSHHEAVASLSGVDQEYWLNFAEDNHISVGELRLMLRDAKPKLPEPAEIEERGQSKGRWLDEQTIDQIALLIDQTRDIMAMPHLDRNSAITLIDRIRDILIGEYDDSL